MCEWPTRAARWDDDSQPHRRAPDKLDNVSLHYGSAAVGAQVQQASHIDHLGAVRRCAARRRLGRQVHVRQILLDQGGQYRLHVRGLVSARVMPVLMVHRRTVDGGPLLRRQRCCRRRRLRARRPSAQLPSAVCRVPSKVRPRTYVLMVVGMVVVVVQIGVVQLLIVEALLQRSGLLAAHALQHAVEHLAHAHAKVAAEEGVQQRIEGGIEVGGEEGERREQRTEVGAARVGVGPVRKGLGGKRFDVIGCCLCFAVKIWFFVYASKNGRKLK